MMIEFLSPERLWALLLVPVLGVLYFALWRRDKARSGGGQRDSLVAMLPQEKTWKKHVAVFLALTSLTLLVTAWARPKEGVEVPRDRATIVVAIDVSRSMLAEDVDPNRLVAAQDAAKDFVAQMPDRFNVSLVTFAAQAKLIVPPTTDHSVVNAAIDNLELEPSTAIGEGVYASLDALSLVPPDPDDPEATAPARIVLLSDGSTNVGRSTDSAAERAKELEVQVYTIAYGTPGGYVISNGQRQPVPVDRYELSQLARNTDGKFYSAENAEQLDEAYEDIARSVGYETVDQETTVNWAGWALGAAALAAMGAVALAARWP